MTDLRGRTFSDLIAGLNAGQHLAVDALVAFVDGELAPGAHDRAAAHITGCRSCAAEIAAQRQARSVVRSAYCPSAPADLLAALRDIPHTADLPGAPAGLAVTEEGVVVQGGDSNRLPTGPLGGGPRWGTGPSPISRWIGW
ncbi:MAG TPA: zf-HC2 domain-containing protein [Pseudonocardiaceae bacterium]|jgi:anti-sigma factor RsiW|nr:zf-HC2 domain-containing protein [Pseudonocardiaceae bacterium]